MHRSWLTINLSLQYYLRFHCHSGFKPLQLSVNSKKTKLLKMTLSLFRYTSETREHELFLKTLKGKYDGTKIEQK